MLYFTLFSLLYYRYGCKWRRVPGHMYICLCCIYIAPHIHMFILYIHPYMHIYIYYIYIYTCIHLYVYIKQSAAAVDIYIHTYIHIWRGAAFMRLYCTTAAVLNCFSLLYYRHGCKRQSAARRCCYAALGEKNSCNHAYLRGHEAH